MKRLAILTTIAFTLSSPSITGCTGSESKSDSKVQATKSTSNEYISPLPADAPVIKVGTEANYTPFEFEDEYGQVIGFDIDLIRAIGENQGFKVEMYNDPWEEVFTNLDSGKRNMIAAGLSSNPERKKKYEISNPYITSHIEVAYSTNMPKINNMNQLKSLRFAGVADTNEVNVLKSEISDLQFQAYPTLYLAITAMVQGEADAVVAESNVLHYFLSELEVEVQYYNYKPDAKINEFSGLFFVIEKENTELLGKVNAGLTAVESDGTYSQLTKKWFGSDLTPALVEQRRKLNK